MRKILRKVFSVVISSSPSFLTLFYFWLFGMASSLSWAEAEKILPLSEQKDLDISNLSLSDLKQSEISVSDLSVHSLGPNSPQLDQAINKCNQGDSLKERRHCRMKARQDWEKQEKEKKNTTEKAVEKEIKIQEVK